VGDYDPKNIRRMSDLLNSIASVTMVLASISAALTVLGTFISAGTIGQLAGLIVLSGLVNAVLTVGAGYLLALGMRAAARSNACIPSSTSPLLTSARPSAICTG